MKPSQRRNNNIGNWFWVVNQSYATNFCPAAPKNRDPVPRIGYWLWIPGTFHGVVQSVLHYKYATISADLRRLTRADCRSIRGQGKWMNISIKSTNILKSQVIYWLPTRETWWPKWPVKRDIGQSGGGRQRESKGPCQSVISQAARVQSKEISKVRDIIINYVRLGMPSTVQETGGNTVTIRGSAAESWQNNRARQLAVPFFYFTNRQERMRNEKNLEI